MSRGQGAEDKEQRKGSRGREQWKGSRGKRAGSRGQVSRGQGAEGRGQRAGSRVHGQQEMGANKVFYDTAEEKRRAKFI